MTVLALSVGAANASLRSEHVLVHVGKAAQIRHRRVHRVDVRLIRRLRASTWRWQSTMGLRTTRLPMSPSTPRTLRAWRLVARQTFLRYVNPPHKRDWLCIHRYEGSWSDSGDPY